MRNNLIVLAYHSINPLPYSKESSALTVHPDQFEAQIRLLQRMGFRNISAKELLAKPNSKEKRFLISFDDGYKDNLTFALPILRKLHCSALIFLSTRGMEDGFEIDAPYPVFIPFLSWDEVREMEEFGIEFGSHTINHAHLSQLDKAALQKEIEDSKEVLEDKLMHKTEYFCAPYGDYPPAAYELVQKHYRISFLTYAYRSSYARCQDVISRIGVYRQNSVAVFCIKILRDWLRML